MVKQKLEKPAKKYIDTVFNLSLPFLYLISLMIMTLPFKVLADPPKGYDFIPYDEGLRVAKKTGKKVFLYYGRYGCGFCDKTNKESFSNNEVQKRYNDHYVLVYVDAEGGRRLTLPTGERITEQQLGARLKALVTPYFMFLEPDGTQVIKVPGYKTVREFLIFDRYIHENHYKSKSLSQFSKEAF